jgi:hypothetical protein
LTLEGPGCYSPVCQQIGRAGWVQGSQPAAQRVGRSAPRANSHHRQPFPRGHWVGTLAGSVPIQEPEVVSVEAAAPMVALVALPVSIALFGWLTYRLLRPGRRR